MGELVQKLERQWEGCCICSIADLVSEDSTLDQHSYSGDSLKSDSGQMEG